MVGPRVQIAFRVSEEFRDRLDAVVEALRYRDMFDPARIDRSSVLIQMVGTGLLLAEHRLGFPLVRPKRNPAEALRFFRRLELNLESDLMAVRSVIQELEGQLRDAGADYDGNV